MLSWLLGGGMIPMLLGAVGLFFLVYLRLLPMRAPRRMLRAMRGAGGETGVSPFRALTVALAGTLGVGNIVGVANAIWIGGAGAVFWMWISAFVAMILKYGEIVLAVRHRRQGRDGSFHGGAYCYIKDYFDRRGKLLIGAIVSSAFALLILANALSMGCIIQVNAVSSAFSGIAGISPWVTAVLFLLCILPFVGRGSGGISSLTEHLVPIMTGGYVILSVTVLLICRNRVGEALADILCGAFSPVSAAGGLIGFLTSQGLRVGVMRGLLSNEAGCGTAPTAHAAAHTKSPAAQGVWGILEVFVDTILLCTATALVILVSFEDVSMLGHDPVMMAVRAYTTVLGEWASWFFCIAIFCFGYATVLCWGGYAYESLAFLSTKKRYRLAYAVLLGIAVFVGALCAPSGVWMLSDAVIASLTVVNLCMLVLMRHEIKQETMDWYQSRA